MLLYCYYDTMVGKKRKVVYWFISQEDYSGFGLSNERWWPRQYSIRRRWKGEDVRNNSLYTLHEWFTFNKSDTNIIQAIIMQEKLYPELWIKNLPPRRKIYFLNESTGGKEEKHIFTQLVFTIATIYSTDL